MEGTIKINGKLLDVKIEIKENNIVIGVPKDADLTNWLHAIWIEREK